MGHISSTVKQTSKPSSLKRHKRWEDRSARRSRLCLEEIQVDCNDNQENMNPAMAPQNEPEMVELYRIFDETETEVPEVNVTTVSTGTQTELSLIDLEIPKNCATSKPIEESISRESFEKDADKLKFYTGLPATTVFMAVLNLLLCKLAPFGCFFRAPQKHWFIFVYFCILRPQLPKAAF